MAKKKRKPKVELNVAGILDKIEAADEVTEELRAAGPRLLAKAVLQPGVKSLRGVARRAGCDVSYLSQVANRHIPISRATFAAVVRECWPVYWASRGVQGDVQPPESDERE